MADTRSHASAKEKLKLKKRTGSVSTVASNEHQKKRGYAGSVCTVLSHKDDPNDGDYIMGGRVQYENTYKMEPDDRFPVGPISNVLYTALEHHLEDQT